MSPKASAFRLQLAIQGGGAKICTLLAAMEAVQSLEEEGILKVTGVAGTSAGAIVGCLFAAGIKMDEVRSRLQALTPDQLARLFPPPGLNILTRLSWGRPLWKPKFLEAELEHYFKKKA